jgi:prepilin-type N-terminal cleavage/methylation domain-containing protein
MTSSSGFTLVELSIVLVIIGLILGGVMVGRSMIQSARLNKVGGEFEQYSAVLALFVDKYQGLPGDMTNASQFWAGSANGNGDGQITGSSPEPFEFWRELARAGMIKGSFTGVTGPGNAIDAIIGVNVPASAYTGGGYTATYVGGQLSGTCCHFNGYYGNGLFFGAQYATPSHTWGRLLRPEQMLTLDTKYDDGKPGTGIMRAWANETCADTTVVTATDTAVYNLSSTAICSFIFLFGN